jgi:hypothetical protein
MEHENSALVRSDYDKLPREANKTKDSTFDRIYKYYHNDKTRIELTGEEHAIRERLEKAWLLMCRHRTGKQVAELIEKIFKVSRSVAYDDIRKAKNLFTDPQNDLKDAKRAIHEEMVLRGADRCWKNGDMDGYWKFTKEYGVINNLGADDGNGVGDLLKKLKAQQVIIVADPEDLLDKARKIQDELTHDIEFEDTK